MHKDFVGIEMEHPVCEFTSDWGHDLAHFRELGDILGKRGLYIAEILWIYGLTAFWTGLKLEIMKRIYTLFWNLTLMSLRGNWAQALQERLCEWDMSFMVLGSWDMTSIGGARPDEWSELPIPRSL